MVSSIGGLVVGVFGFGRSAVSAVGVSGGRGSEDPAERLGAVVGPAAAEGGEDHDDARYGSGLEQVLRDVGARAWSYSWRAIAPLNR